MLMLSYFLIGFNVFGVLILISAVEVGHHAEQKTSLPSTSPFIELIKSC